jgi:septal ring-binding cell division protein DamX
MLEDVLPPAIQPIHPTPAESVRHEQKGEVASSAQRGKALVPADSQGDARQRAQARPSGRKSLSGRDNITPAVVKKTKTSKKKKSGAADFEQDDLRGVVLRGKEVKPPLDAYRALKEAGYIQSAAEFL